MMRFLLGALALLIACSATGGETSTPVTVRDSAGVAIVTNDLARLPAICPVDTTPSVLIGVAEGPEEYMLHRVFGATQLSDGRIVLVNQGTEEIRYYGPDGKFLMRSGRRGRGPGEFSDAFYIWLTRGDTIYVGDYRPWQFLVFDQNGTWVRTIRPEPPFVNPPAVIEVLADGWMVLANDEWPELTGPGFKMREITTALYSPDGAAADTLETLPNGRLGVLPGASKSFLLAPWFESHAQVAGGGTRIASGHGARPELRMRDARGSHAIRRIVRWTGQDQTITSDLLAAARRAEEAEFVDASPEVRKRFLEPSLRDDRPVADELPAFTGVRIGRDGRLWVRVFSRPGSTEIEHWVGFDSTGRYTCRFSMPSNQELLEVGSDYLLTKDPDADGVERVARFGLGQPAEK